jgi:hypothetical protein
MKTEALVQIRPHRFRHCLSIYALGVGAALPLMLLSSWHSSLPFWYIGLLALTQAAVLASVGAAVAITFYLVSRGKNYAAALGISAFIGICMSFVMAYSTIRSIL